MTIFGLPVHPLVVHAAVVLAPLSALAVLGYACVPQWRWALRYPATLGAIAAAASVQLAAMTGDALEHTVRPNHFLALHEMWAGRLQAAAWVLAAAAALAWYVVPHTSPIPAAGRSHRTFTAAPVLAQGSVVVAALAAVATLALVVLTGHAGAQAVWANGG